MRVCDKKRFGISIEMALSIGSLSQGLKSTIASLAFLLPRAHLCGTPVLQSTQHLLPGFSMRWGLCRAKVQTGARPLLFLHRWVSMASVAYLRRPDHCGRAGSTRCNGVAVPSQCWAERVRCRRSPLHHPSNIQNSWYLALVMENQWEKNMDNHFVAELTLGFIGFTWLEELSISFSGLFEVPYTKIRQGIPDQNMGNYPYKPLYKHSFPFMSS